MPLVTCVLTASTFHPPVKYCSIAAFRSTFSATTLLFPFAWHAAQLPRKTLSPFSRSAASAGRLPRTAPTASGLHALVPAAGAASPSVAHAVLDACWAASGMAGGFTGATKQHAPYRASEAAARRHAERNMALARAGSLTQDGRESGRPQDRA